MTKLNKEIIAKAAIAFLIPLVLGLCTWVGASLWQIQPTVAAHSQQLQELDQKAERAYEASEAANRRQVEILIKLNRIEERIQNLGGRTDSEEEAQ